jgi:FtsP/CotA-like multicopper oxidase with cupredoxin domain
MNEKTRRNFLIDAAAASTLLLGGCNRTASTGTGGTASSSPADVTLRIGPVLADIAKEHTISTIGYNGTVPGPLIRFHEGAPVTVELFNEHLRHTFPASKLTKPCLSVMAATEEPPEHWKTWKVVRKDS